MTKSTKAILTTIVLAILFLILLFSMAGPTGDTLTSKFRSPSGAVMIRIEESCFGFACSQEAYLVKPLLDKHLGDLNVGDPENLVFDTARVTWNKDETEMRWSVSTRLGTKIGTLRIK